MDHRITYYHGSPQFTNFEHFLTTCSPSTVTRHQCSWIAVHCPEREAPNRTNLHLEGLLKEWQHLQSTNNVSVNAISYLARKYNCLVGKWLLFPRKDQVDQVWSTIVRAVLAGQLGHYAKVAPQEPNNNNHTLCVYTTDCSNMQDVMRVREQLWNLGFTHTLSYKPDIYTYLGIYKNNRWGIHPAIYCK